MPKYVHRINVKAELCFNLRTDQKRVTRKQIIEQIERHIDQWEGIEFPEMEEGRIYAYRPGEKMNQRISQVVYTETDE